MIRNLNFLFKIEFRKFEAKFEKSIFRSKFEILSLKIRTFKIWKFKNLFQSLVVNFLGIVPNIINISFDFDSATTWGMTWLNSDFFQIWLTVKTSGWHKKYYDPYINIYIDKLLNPWRATLRTKYTVYTRFCYCKVWKNMWHLQTVEMTKIENFSEIIDEIWSILGEKSKLQRNYWWDLVDTWWKIEILGKNRNFGEKSKFWSEIEVLVQNWNFGQK